MCQRGFSWHDRWTYEVVEAGTLEHGDGAGGVLGGDGLGLELSLQNMTE